MMRERLGNIESQIEPAVTITADADFVLELAALEMVLLLKQEEGLSFETGLQSALVSTGNEWLFAFPAERFPIETKNAAAIRIHAGMECKIYYVHQADTDNEFEIVGDDKIHPDYIHFADSFAEVATALGPLISKGRANELH